MIFRGNLKFFKEFVVLTTNFDEFQEVSKVFDCISKKFNDFSKELKGL